MAGLHLPGISGAAVSIAPGSAGAGGAGAEQTPPPQGQEHLDSMPHVAQRMNFHLFQQVPIGSLVRVTGQIINQSGAMVLKTTDGQILQLQVPFDGNILNRYLQCFVEVIGHKLGDMHMQSTIVLPLPGDFDAGLWDEFVKLHHEPKLRDLYTPQPPRQLQLQ
eukprot:TRINITY_DN81341_c0_g1_i1.p1 TRINITY_DN81341_c0_g1~~TRINITY_DN81341_c0_g1_i1.p1  ORF type:complete len:163 (+),score=39.61 TRINITY_DN81341_c0_g1_i1:66-554(+)